MNLTRFRKLRRAVESLDAHIIAKKIGTLEAHLQKEGLPFEPDNTAITQEGIFYIEPESGIATKVIAHIGDFPARLTKAQVENLDPEGYGDHSSVEKFHPYHLMRCNTLTHSESKGWKESYRITKRTDGKFYYRIVSEIENEGDKPEVYQAIANQKLYICSYCMWKVSSIVVAAQGVERENFDLKMFFDVNMLHSWNSRGMLSKDYGFTKDMYPDDWLEICRIRKEQTHYTCEQCFQDLNMQQMRRFLYVNPTDHVEGRDGYVRLECLCIGCMGEQPRCEHIKQRQEYRQYMNALRQLKATHSFEKQSVPKDSRTSF